MAIRYPDSYRTPTTGAAQINLDPCKQEIDHVSFPATWLGRRSLPAIQGAPLKPEWLRGMNLKDIGLQPGTRPSSCPAPPVHPPAAAVTCLPRWSARCVA